MKLCPMMVQGFWEFKNPLLQLPHITEDNLKHFLAKKVRSELNFIQKKLKQKTKCNFFFIILETNKKSPTIRTTQR